YGDVPGGVINLYPVQPGQITRLDAQEQKFYHAGDALLVVDEKPARLVLNKAKAALRLAQEELRQAETLPKKLRDDLIKRQKAAKEAAEHEQAAAERDWEYKQELAKKELTHKKVAQAAEELVKRLKAKARAEQRKLEQLEGEDVEAKARLAREVVKAREI